MSEDRLSLNSAPLSDLACTCECGSRDVSVERETEGHKRYQVTCRSCGRVWFVSVVGSVA